MTGTRQTGWKFLVGVPGTGAYRQRTGRAAVSGPWGGRPEGRGGEWRAGSGRASWALLGPWPWLPERREPREVARSNARLQRLPPAAEVSMFSGVPTR